MTLFEFVKVMEKIASIQPNINEIVPGDVYLLNSKKDAEFSVFSWQHRQHQELSDVPDVRLYSFTLFYIDRETQDKSNILEAQSTGFEVLSNIIKTIVEELSIEIYGNIIYQPFEQRFSQECAGIYANVTFLVPINCICPEEYL
jgi:hypothetical protein